MVMLFTATSKKAVSEYYYNKELLILLGLPRPNRTDINLVVDWA